MGFEQQSWDLSLKAGIGVSGPGFESQGQDLSLKAGIWASTVRYQFQKEGGGRTEISHPRIAHGQLKKWRAGQWPQRADVL